MRWLVATAFLLCSHMAQAQSDRDATLQHLGVERRYVLHLPPGAPDAGPRPLVLALHGLDRDGDSADAVHWFRAWWTMDAIADREGFAVVYPEAIAGRWNYGDGRPTPLPGGTDPADDVGFLAALLDRLVADHIADPAHLFVTGASRGGLMTWTLACSMPQRFSAAAPLITPMTGAQLADCRPAQLMPLLALAGTDDRSQPYEGWLYPDLGIRTASMPETMEFWRRLHGCTDETARAVPHRPDTGRTRAALISWTGCTDGGAVQLLRIAGGGHQLPTLTPDERPRAPGDARNHDLETAEEVWRFFQSGKLSISEPAP